jgi:hypothetical protein
MRCFQCTSMVAPVVSTTRSCDGQAGGCLSHSGGSDFLVGGSGSPFYCCFVYLQRTTTVGIGAITSAVRDYVVWPRSWQRQRGATRLAADRGGLLQHGWNHPVRYNVTRRRRRHPWSASSTTTSSCEESNDRNSVFNGDFGVVLSFGGGASLHTLAASSRRVRSVSVVAGVVTPCTREEGSNGGRGEAPARCDLLWLGVSLRQVVLLCCSGFAAKGPTRWRPSRCGGVYHCLLLFNVGSLSSDRCL